ncbi:MAG: hypothetical protein NTW21_26440 [Verrucomicrobia bacterium]|nr:hypothetical protein [Verrucomicrobiota bacterium]
MKFLRFFVIAILSCVPAAPAAVRIDQQTFGASLGGWTKRGNQAAEYPLSGATYRTYKPEVTPTPDGGLFVSLRIDHVRGWLSSDDHAVLEITVSASGNIESAQSTIAIQGRSITTDLIRSGSEAGKKLVGVDRAVQIGTDLVADLTAKMLQEKLVEAGRVSYPAVLRHNYNLLFQAIRSEAEPSPEKPATGDQPGPPKEKPSPGDAPAAPPEEPPAEPAKPAPPPKTAAKLEIKPVGEAPKNDLPVKK